MQLLPPNWFSRTLLLLVFVCASLTNEAQTLNLAIYKKSDGFPGNDIYAGVQDPEGILWFAGSGGIASFDGTSPVHVPIPDSIGPTVKALYCDSAGYIWFCTVESHVGRFHHTTPEDVVLLNNGVALFGPVGRPAITLDAEQTVWVSAGGVFRSFDAGETFERVDHPDSLLKPGVNTMAESRDGGIWFGGRGRIAKYSHGKFHVADSLLPITKHSIISCFYESSNGKLYAGTSGLGVLIFDDPSVFTQPSKIDSTAFTRIAPGGYYAANSLICIGEQADGKVWLLAYAATYLLSYNHLEQPVTEEYSGINGLPTPLILSTFQDSERNIWFCTYRHGAVQLPFFTQEVRMHYTETDRASVKANNVTAITMDEDDNLWLGTRNGLFRGKRDPINTTIEFSLASRLLDIHSQAGNINAMAPGSDGSVLISSYGGGSVHYRPDGSTMHFSYELGIPNYVNYDLIQKSQDTILFSHKAGVSLFDTKSQSITNITGPAGWRADAVHIDRKGKTWFGTTNGLAYLQDTSLHMLPILQEYNNPGVLSLTEDLEGNLWFAVNGAGVFKLKEDGSLLKIGLEEGLTSNDFRWIHFDRRGRLWVAGDKGIDRLELDYLSITHIPSIVYRDAELNLNAVVEDMHGTMWFGTSTGLVSLPTSLESLELPMPRITIDYIQQANGVSVLGDTTLEHGQNNLRFGLKTITFTAPERVQLQWKLKGVDAQWSDPSTARVVSYPNLEPGTYEFLARATKDGERWTDPVRYSFTIEPPFWQRLWFQITAALLFLLLIFVTNRGLIAARTASLERAKQFLERSLQERNVELETSNAELAKLSIVAENTDNAVYICDAKGRIEWVNKAFTKMMGYPASAVVGTFGQSMRDLDSLQAINGNNICEPVIQSKRAMSFALPNKKKDGTEIWTYTSLTPIFDDDEHILKIIVLDTDITERIESEEALKEAKNRAEESEKIKERFLANMSHEIRTPMNAIVGMVELLAKSEQPPKEQRYIRTIRSAIRNLLVIIDDILDFSKIEAGKITFERTSFQLGTMLEEVAELQRSKATQKGIELVCNVAPGIPQYVVGDPVRLGQILHNLVSNAIKFTETGSVTIAVNVKQQEPETLHLDFAVTDTGIGISEEKQSLIFDSFTQERADTTRKYGGTGLGLAIALQLVELQGGTMELKSEIGTGSTFHFGLSFGLNTEGVEQWDQVAEHSGGEGLKGLRVLLVDDNQLNHEVAESLLLDWMPDIHIDPAWNGRQAIDLLNVNAYDIVLMDIQMPELDGYETSRLIRSDSGEPAKSTPIIAMTANAMAGEAERCRAAGMNGYVPKPIDGKRLASTIEELLGKKGTQAAADAPNEPNLVGEVSNLEGLYRSARGDVRRVKRYINIVLKNTPGDLERLIDAHNTKDWEFLAAKAHDMKGNMGYIGAETLVERLETLRSIVLNDKNEQQLSDLIGSITEDCHTALKELEAIAKQLD